MKPKRVCPAPGCHNLIRTGRYCPEHSIAGEGAGRQFPGYTKQEKAAYQKAYTKKHGSSSKRGYGTKWRKARLAYLIEHPLCKICGRPAECVDHIRPFLSKDGEIDQQLFWDQSNWQPLCNSCHSRKTANEDSSWLSSRRSLKR